MTDLATTCAQLLIKHQAVKISLDPPFAFSSGLKSPIYCDNRLLISIPEARDIIIQGWKKIITEQKLQFDTIAGTATAAIPWAAFLAYELGVPMLYVRPKPKTHGASKQIEGRIMPGSRVLVVEDLISTGSSAVASAQACQKEFQAEIVGIVAIFTYQLKKAQQALRKAGFSCFTLSDLSALLQIANLPAADEKLVLDFTENPDAWQEVAG